MATNFSVSSWQGFKALRPFALRAILAHPCHPCLTLAWASQLCKIRKDQLIIQLGGQSHGHWTHALTLMMRILIPAANRSYGWSLSSCNPIIIRILKFFTMCLCNLKSPHEQTSTCEICNQNFAEVLWGSLTRPFWLSKNMFNLSLHKQDLERSSLPPCTPHPQLSVDERAHSVVYRAYHGALCSRQSSELWVENPTADLIFS